MTNRYMIEDFYKVVILINGSDMINRYMIEDFYKVVILMAVNSVNKYGMNI